MAAPARGSKAAPAVGYLRTPLVESAPLSRALGRRVWLKMDALQPSGSFKLRGMSLACARAKARGAKLLVSSSGGNAGLAVAYAGRQMGMPVTVCVPETTPEFIRDRLATFGATVEVHGSMWAQAHERALQLADELQGALMHPFDMPDLWEGHGTLVHELQEELVRALAGCSLEQQLPPTSPGGTLSGFPAAPLPPGRGAPPEGRDRLTPAPLPDIPRRRASGGWPSPGASWRAWAAGAS